MIPQFSLAGLAGRLFLASLSLGVAALAWANDPAKSPAPAESASAAPAKADSAQAPAAASPADGKTWYVDDKTGARYSIESVPKVEGTYKWLDQSRVRFPGGATFEIVDHDATSFRVKAWEVVETPVYPKPKAPRVDPEQLAAEYKFEWPQVDRLALAPFGTGLPKKGQWRNGFDLFDMDKDGNLDMVFGPARKGRQQPNIFLSDGKGNWRRAEGLRFPAEPFDYGDIAVGDFDGDGSADLAMAIHLRGVLVLTSDGGGFKNWSKGINLDRPGGSAIAYSSRSIDTVDWNGDGKLDVIVAGEGPKGLKSVPKDGEAMDSSRGIRVFLNQGDGSWKVEQTDDLPGKRPNFTDTFAMGDFNRDKRLDVFTGTRQIGNQSLYGIRQADGKLAFEDFPLLRPNALVLVTITQDLDGDGWLDLGVAYQANQGGWRSGIDIFWGSKDGFTRQALFNRQSKVGISGLAAGDVDGDGKADVVGFSQSAEGFIFLGDGKRQWKVEQSIAELPTVRQGCSAAQVSLADLNGDRRDEILVSFAGEAGGYPGIIETAGCDGEGSIEVWSPTLKP